MTMDQIWLRSPRSPRRFRSCVSELGRGVVVGRRSSGSRGRGDKIFLDAVVVGWRGGTRITNRAGRVLLDVRRQCVIVGFVGRRKRQSVGRRRWYIQPLYAHLQVLNHPSTRLVSLVVRPLFRQKVLNLFHALPVPCHVQVRPGRRYRRLPLQVPDRHLQDIRLFQFVHSGQILSGLQ